MNIEDLDGVHEEGCDGYHCTCKLQDTATILEFPSKDEEKITSTDVLYGMLEEDLDTCLVVGFKGDDLYILNTPLSDKEKELYKEAGELLLKL